ncbi:gamma-interferon inducible lysosomal thiol reductase gilt [Holotrichia oblita]|uniref:Gamma-interferon inducible lysosomal thiol reductase gilt n=1 Tax=Holotrichia oblita TaxID=644536 RepID=A0ACB9SUP8_HOLOL|nr:gamma-interferon inducible lysosomal thiol reductase gilt [Holotrichia oblita]
MLSGSFAGAIEQLEANPDAKRLYDDLLSNYNRLIRPVENHTQTLTVYLGLKLSQLIEMNLKNQVMTTNLWVVQVDLKHIEQSEGSNIVKTGIDLSEFYLSVEWDILAVPATRNEEYYPCCTEPYSEVYISCDTQLLHSEKNCIVQMKTFEDNIKVSIFYESLCPDSIRFITQQLYPNNDAVGRYITVDFVPYGKATHVLENGVWQFTCQHGPNECHGNMMQACALDIIDDQDIKVNFVNCVMSSPYPANDSYIEECADVNGIAWASIVECAEDGSGADLLAALGERTHAVEPTITFVPTIIYNDVYDASLQSSSLTDFLGTKIRVTILYESLCSDSEEFIDKQLVQCYDSIKDNVDIEFVPYGKASHKKTSTGWTFKCQHGPRECELNIQHACGIKHASSQSQQVKFVNCMMKEANETNGNTAIKTCTSKNSISFDDVSRCYGGAEGQKLHAEHGDRTNKFTIIDIPTIIFNNTFDQHYQDRALKNLYSVINELCVREKIRVTILYESLCPDSEDFINKQLVQCYDSIKDNVNIEFVPYGKATVYPFSVLA